ncbi:MAG: response regulator, partial [Defluviitaleaceae bacterium]|nr:response regulator [Defluviitaleaceae bacterium]
AAQLRRVILAVLSNAVESTGSGSITLVAKSDAAPSEEKKVTIIFEISCTGTRQGEPPPCLPNLHIDTIPGIGSRASFSISFDVSPYLALVCEDGEITRRAIRANIEKAGLSVIEAENGEAAVEAVQTREPDIIFMDIQMPVTDGLSAARKLAEMGVKAPIIAMTSNFSEDDMTAYKESGMAGHIRKPFRMEELIFVLQKHLICNERNTSVSIRTEAPSPYPDPSAAPIDKPLALENNAGSEDLFYESLDAFALEQPQNLTSLEEAISKRDLVLANRIAHTNKNSAAIIGAARLAEISAVLEEALRRDGSYFKDRMLKDYSDELSRVIAYINSLNCSAARSRSLPNNQNT